MKSWKEFLYVNKRGSYSDSLSVRAHHQVNGYEYLLKLISPHKNTLMNSS